MPEDRPTAGDALRHDYFKSLPQSIYSIQNGNLMLLYFFRRLSISLF
jgi:hypothetical protein